MNKTTHGQICKECANSYANSSVSSVRPHAPFNLSADVQESFLPAWRQTTLGARPSSLTTAAESLAFGLQLFDSYSTIQKRRRKKIMIAQFSQSAFAWQFQTSDNKAWASHGPCLKFFVFNNFFIYIFVCQSFDGLFNPWHSKGVKNSITLPFHDGSEMPTVEWMISKQP